MAREVLEYKGHQIEAETRKVGRGFGWTYMIDGDIYKDSTDRPLRSEHIMLNEAIDAAKRVIDSMPTK